ncbi:DUF4363 family protein [Clostridium sp. KNHs214]|uniref:DUF4363 family protein n=1 Tax=Clostridium sp. KNHs214 TaxID=1540257 RepID=UPI0005576095|nr:DUF4363 family protein [Clostridium sp. KNHs214]
MKNIVISFIIFILMIFGIAFSTRYMTSVCNNLLQKNAKLEQIVEEEAWEHGYNDSVKLLNAWEKEYDKLTVFVHHEKIDAINNELLQLTQYVQCKDKSESLAKIHVVKTYLKNIIDSEKINIQNIF